MNKRYHSSKLLKNSSANVLAASNKLDHLLKANTADLNKKERQVRSVPKLKMFEQTDCISIPKFEPSKYSLIMKAAQMNPKTNIFSSIFPSLSNKS